MPSARPSRRMSAEDAWFLYFEKPEAPLHIGSVAIFEGDIPFERLREFVVEVKLQLVHGVTLRYLFVLGLYTSLVWLLYAVPTFLTIQWVAGLGLTMGQTLAVFVLSALGMAMPSSPGAVGVFEAAVIFGLGLFGVDKELALAIGLLIHMMQYIPTTVAGLMVLLKSGLSLKTIRHSDQALEDA